MAIRLLIFVAMATALYTIAQPILPDATAGELIGCLFGILIIGTIVLQILKKLTNWLWSVE